MSEKWDGILQRSFLYEEEKKPSLRGFSLLFFFLQKLIFFTFHFSLFFSFLYFSKKSDFYQEIEMKQNK